MIYLDTHAVIWLYAGEIDLFPAKAKDAIEASELLISPAVLLELQFLKEIGRIKVSPSKDSRLSGIPDRIAGMRTAVYQHNLAFTKSVVDP